MTSWRQIFPLETSFYYFFYLRRAVEVALVVFKHKIMDLSISLTIYRRCSVFFTKMFMDFTSLHFEVYLSFLWFTYRFDCVEILSSTDHAVENPSRHFVSYPLGPAVMRNVVGISWFKYLFAE